MQPAGEATRSPWTWLLTIVLFVATCVLLPRTALFWIPFETAARLDATVGLQAGRQSMEAASKLARPRRPAEHRVAVLGNSRIWFGAPDWILERELRAQRPGLDVRVDGLAVFGMRIGDLEMVARHLGRADPEVVVLALGGTELLPTEWGELVNKTGRYFDTGFAAGPLPTRLGESARRWLNTLLPLVRLRQFGRKALDWRLGLDEGQTEVPASFADAREVFDFLYGEHAPEIHARYRRFLHTRSLDDYVLYLRAGGRTNVELPDRDALQPDGDGPRILDALLARFEADGRRCLVLLMPDNPLLIQDRLGFFHRPGFREHATRIIRSVAERHGARVVDGRFWLEAPDFLDFYHPLPDVGGLQRPLAREVLHELDS